MTGNVVDGERIVNYAKKEDRSAIPGQQIDVHRQFKLLREVLLALELIHEQGMVHLDIKPENIFVKDNLYKLGDFGLVHGFSKSEGSEKISSISDIEEGDSRYMPKDLLSDDHRDLTKVSIIFCAVIITHSLQTLIPQYNPHLPLLFHISLHCTKV